MPADPNPVCFVIAPIGDSESEVRKRSDQILKHLIEPVCSSAGYRPIRADHISEPGIITTQVIQHILEDPMVVADLTGKNPNVFYELAIRHALRKPYVQIIQQGERIPFDVSAIRTIEVDHHDLDSVENAKAEILRQMESMAGRRCVVDSPISVAVDLDFLRQSGRPEDRELGAVLTAVAELGSSVAGISKRLSDPGGVLPPAYIRDLLVRELRPLFFELRDSVSERPRVSDAVIAELAFSLNQIRQSLETEGPSGFNRDQARDALSAVIKQLGIAVQSMRPGSLEQAGSRG